MWVGLNSIDHTTGINDVVTIWCCLDQISGISDVLMWAGLNFIDHTTGIDDVVTIWVGFQTSGRNDVVIMRVGLNHFQLVLSRPDQRYDWRGYICLRMIPQQSEQRNYQQICDRIGWKE
ncbi:hypothetical protein RRG08_001552 [Elysia crispata]|uniref:Uncharacterized protein n=1 Tax=Elysia crispata TaxID=231223 RepID=A0AAE1AJU8_9GAST|nr:hypothetical protein RRG08_001552 [Elysia crispata]